VYSILFLNARRPLVSLMLLLRQRGQLTASELADELEVSSRTVLRDIAALSAAGTPVYAERGRHGGFALLPGFRTELTGLNHDEALALLVAGSRRGVHAFGLDSALASAMLKVVDALPESYRETAADVAERMLIDPEKDLLARRTRPHCCSANDGSCCSACGALCLLRERAVLGRDRLGSCVGRTGGR
jgi:predicted DNA-binding transcriptional regulator YafY